MIKLTTPTSGGFAPEALVALYSSDERERFLGTAERRSPHYFPFILFLAETGCRDSEAINLCWADVDLDAADARVHRQKTGARPDNVKLSERLRDVLRRVKPDLHPPDMPAGTTEQGYAIRHENFRRRIWNPLVRETFGPDRRVTPHTLRHTWASLHLARGTPIEWVRVAGGWTSAKMLLDVYGTTCRATCDVSRILGRHPTAPDRTKLSDRAELGSLRRRKSLTPNGITWLPGTDLNRRPSG